MLGIVVTLSFKMPRMNGEVELGHSFVLELVLVEEVKICAHHRLEAVFPDRIVEDHLAGTSKMALVPILHLLSKLPIVHAPTRMPTPLHFWQVGRWEGHEERGDRHRQA